MRLVRRSLSTVYLKRRTVTYDEEGEEMTTYADEPIEFKMLVQSAGGRVDAQIYGARLPYIKSCKYQGELLKPVQNELDGVCVYVDKTDEPDYRIIDIQPYTDHLNVTLERING